MPAIPAESQRAGAPAATLSASELRASLQPYLRPSVPLAVALVSADFVAFATMTVLTAYFDHWALRLVASLGAGLAIGRLFVLGHDAIHTGYTHNKRLDNFIGRAAFLVILHNFSLWRIVHNRFHHKITNVQGFNSWSPLSPAEFAALPRWRRWIYRFYRTPYGLGPYYLVERWWKDKFFPTRRIVGTMKPKYWWDFALVSSFLALWLGTVLAVAAPSSLGGVLAALWWGFVLPYGIWNYLMGFTVYSQHTHPVVPWFRTQEESEAAVGQEDVTVHVAFPLWYEWLSHHGMNHPAHHLSPKIPCYRLRAAQKHLHSLLGPRSVMVPFSFAWLWRTMRLCQVYDYEKHHWLDSRGRVVPQSMPSASAAASVSARPAVAAAE